MAISSKIDSKLGIEPEVTQWKEAGLLKPSLLKSAVATIEKEFVITKLGSLQSGDREVLDQFVERIC